MGRGSTAKQEKERNKSSKGRTGGESSGSDSEGEFQVEQIVDRRLNRRTGKIEYFLKWKGFEHSENSWEPVENLDCDELIEQYEKARNKAEPGRPAESAGRVNDENKKPRGFERGLDAETILGATDTPGELSFLIKWKGCDEADLVPARIANIKIPQTVIKFYEDRLTWCGGNGSHNSSGNN